MLALKRKKEAEAAAAAAAAAGGGGAPAMSVFGAGDDGKVNVGAAKRKESSGQLRMQKDVAEFEQYDFLQVVWPNDKDVMRCVLKCRPKGGYWSGACVDFQMDFSHEDYPIKPPKVTCISRVYHPNISLEGAVCLSMLKERHTDVNGIDDGWKPVHTLTTIAMGVLSLFMEPNPDDPLHIRACLLGAASNFTLNHPAPRPLPSLHRAGLPIHARRPPPC